mgnify:CR=1 FL=1
MSTIAELMIKLGMDDGGLDKGMSSSQSKLKDWGESLRSVGTKLTAGVTLPLVGAGLAAINWASDQSEASNKVDVVFGKSAKAVKAWAKSNKGSLLLSSGAAMEAVGTYGNLFTAMGMGQEDAADLSEGLVELAQDLSSFNNIPTDQALIALRAALVGEFEPMRALGVNLSQATVEAKALEMGLWDGTGALDAQSKALAVNALIMEQTTNAQGDAARTADGFSNQTRILRANITDLGASIGERLLPAANQFLAWAIDMVDRLSGLSPMWQNVILGFLGLAAAIGPALLALGFMLPAISALIPVFGLLLSPVGLLALALAGLVAVGIYAWVNDLWGMRDAVDQVTQYLRGFHPVLTDIIDVFQSLRAGDFAEVFDELKDAVLSLGVALTSAQVSSKLRDIGDSLHDSSEKSKDYPKTLDAIGDAMDSNADSVDGYRSAFQQFQQGNYGEGLKQLGLAAVDAYNSFNMFNNGLVHGLAESGLALVGWVAKVTGLKTAWNDFKNLLNVAWSFEGSGIAGFLQAIIDKAKEAKELIDALTFWDNGGGDGSQVSPNNDPRRYEPTKSQPGSNEGAGYPFVGGEMVTTLPAVGSGPQALFDKVQGIAQQITSTITQMAASVSNALKQVDSAFQSTGQAVGSSLTQMQSRVQQSFQQITSTATQATNQLRSAVQSGWQQIAQVVQQSSQQAQQNATNAMNQLRSQVQSALQATVSAVTSAMSQFASQVQSGMQRAVAATQSGVSQIRGVVAGLNLSSQGFSIGASLGQGIAAGIQSYIGTVASAAAALVSTAIAAAKAAAASNSPSKKMMELGSDMAEGMEIGINRGADAVARATADLVNIPNEQPWQQTGNGGGPTYVSIALKTEELIDLLRKVEAGYGFANGFGSELGLYTGQP